MDKHINAEFVASALESIENRDPRNSVGSAVILDLGDRLLEKQRNYRLRQVAAVRRGPAPVLRLR